MLGLLVSNFDAQQIQYACIGGFAMGALGILRNTLDLDFLVRSSDLPQIDQILSAHLLYHLCYRSENVSQYVGDVRPLGNLDLLHAFRPHAIAMLRRARRIPVFDQRIEIPVVLPEDLIGLKLQARTNNPQRNTLETADIELIMSHYSHTLNWSWIQEYFDLFHSQNEFAVLHRKYASAE